MPETSSEHNVMYNASWEAFRDWYEERDYSSMFFLTDEHTYRDCYRRLPETVTGAVNAVMTVPAGERSKSLDQCEEIWDFLLEEGVDRDSLLVNLGGGMICDLGGFCAGTIMRGIDIVHMPTSLLAMVDASIGGKTGINFKGGKNLIGQFVHPALICIQTDFLETLDRRNIRSGMAEMAKHALLESSSRWDAFHEAVTSDELSFGQWIPFSVTFKFEVVDRDFREQGYRQILNLGHTIAHAIESTDSDQEKAEWLHGEAVWAGLWCAAYLSEQKGYSGSEGLKDELAELCRRCIPEQSIPLDALKKVYLDKKRSKERVRMVLLDAPGTPKWPVECSLPEIREAAEQFNRSLAR